MIGCWHHHPTKTVPASDGAMGLIDSISGSYDVVKYTVFLCEKLRCFWIWFFCLSAFMLFPNHSLQSAFKGNPQMLICHPD